MDAAIAHNRPKCIRVTTSEKNLAYFNRNPKECLRPFVTMDETWIHQPNHANHAKDQNSGLNLVKVNQSVRKPNNWLGKLWLVFFGICMNKSSSTTLRKEGCIIGLVG